MANSRANGKTLGSYTVDGIDKSIRPGDCVLMRSPDSSMPPYVAEVEKIELDNRGGNVKFYVRWYYRPEEVIGGRKPYHGIKEVFLSDHRDIQSADTIEGDCTVHTLRSYRRLATVGNDDYFYRFEYRPSTGDFNPDIAIVYCKCQLPYNPDNFMAQCDGCNDWFHPPCIGMTEEEAIEMETFFCDSCPSEEHRILQNSHANSGH